MLRWATALLFGVMVGGCASAPGKICAPAGAGLAVLSSPPSEAEGLLARLRDDVPNAVDETRDHVVWLTSDEGDLYLCTYHRRPIATGSCGATVHHYAKTADGHEGVTVTLSACH